MQKRIDLGPIVILEYYKSMIIDTSVFFKSENEPTQNESKMRFENESVRCGINTITKRRTNLNLQECSNQKDWADFETIF